MNSLKFLNETEFFQICALNCIVRTWKSCSHFVVLRNTGSNTILPQLLPLGEEIQLSSLSVRGHTSPVSFFSNCLPSEEWQLESTKAVAAERGGGRRREQLHGRVGSLQLILLIFLSPKENFLLSSIRKVLKWVKQSESCQLQKTVELQLPPTVSHSGCSIIHQATWAEQSWDQPPLSQVWFSVTTTQKELSNQHFQACQLQYSFQCPSTASLSSR